MKDFSDSNVLITGGGSGVGLEAARQFLERGADVTIMGRTLSKLEQSAQSLKSDRLAVFAGDVSKSVDADAAISFAENKWGRPVDVLVNNAGVILRRSVDETSDGDWARVMDTNVSGLFYMSRAASKSMPEGGTIVNLSSTCGAYGSADLVAYCASKGAVDQITRSMALELAPRKITVNAVAPGAINSPMLFSEHTNQRSLETVMDRNQGSIPIGAIAEPEEIARAILYLASEPHITGSILRIDGGYSAQ